LRRKRVSESRYVMDKKIYASILSWRQKFNLNRTPRFSVYCTKCDHLIHIGDRVISKRRKRSKASIFHEKCYVGSFIDLPEEE